MGEENKETAEQQNKPKENPSGNTTKKPRHRKKQLYSSILQQMEFYFSEPNLTKDRYLSKLMEADPYVDLSVFLKFNKIRNLTTDLEEIKRAVKHSNLIELSEDSTKIGRKEPLKRTKNVDECTIYVEKLKTDATHDWLKSIFAEHGNVVYVSVPKFHDKNTIKGFAFIEYETEGEAQNALSYFESIGCKMQSNVEPHELCSINTFEGESKLVSGELTKEFRKKIEGEEVIIEEEEVKKRKLEEVENLGERQTKKLKQVSEELENKEETTGIENKEVESDKNADLKSPEENKAEVPKKISKKEQKRKNQIKEYGLQVLSKKEWKKMRNRYLDLQKKKMREFKQYIFKAKLNKNNQQNNDNKSEKNTESEENKVKKLEFVEGVIVRIKLELESDKDPKKLKNEIRAKSEFVKYVEVSHDLEEVYVRFESSEEAQKFAQDSYLGEKTVLKGDEETEYWKKIQNDNENKHRKTVKKERGRNKLMKKASQVLATHIKFDD